MQKFMTIFSMLFGASILLRADRMLAPDVASSLHTRRMIWLGVFGILHGYLFWYGDILFGYAVAGWVVFWLRGRSNLVLLSLGIGIYLLSAGLFALRGFDPAAQPVSDDAAPSSLTWNLLEYRPDPASIHREIEAMRGSWVDQFSLRAPITGFFQTFGLLFVFLPMNGSLMLIGMALHRLGLFDARRSPRFYLRIALIALPIGWSAVLLERLYTRSVSPPDSVIQLLGVVNHLAAPVVAIGYCALVMIACLIIRRSILKPLEAVGRIALTCYLMQTALCTLLFYGHGWGYFNRLTRVELLGVAVAIWVVQLTFASACMRHFRFGPMEWVWRRLEDGK
jgi:uncharacterized protein